MGIYWHCKDDDGDYDMMRMLMMRMVTKVTELGECGGKSRWKGNASLPSLLSNRSWCATSYDYGETLMMTDYL